MSENATAVAEVRERKHRGFLADLFLRLVREKPLGTVGGIIVLVLLLTGIFANVLAPYDPIANDMNVRFLPPSGSHILGTDNLGRDLLSRIIFGARISVIVGLAVATIEVFIATAVGIVSGFFGGKTDTIIQRFVDAWMCFPGLVILLTILAVLGQGIGQVIIVLGVVLGIGGSRVMRSAVISIRENVYIEAARAIGSTPGRTLLRHILPNIVAPMIIIFTLAVGTAILIESSLSFLGFGVPPPMPSWGGMLSGSGRTFMLRAPWMALWPGLALAIVVYGVNMLGDALRDLLDPRLRGGLGRYSVAMAKRRKVLEKGAK